MIQCLSSISVQKLRDKIHVIIVDDCSSIDYTDLIHTFDKILSLEYVKLSENHGSGYARNVGLNHSSSEFISFMDSDDSLYSEFSMSLLYDKIKDSDYDFVTGGFVQEHNSPDKINPLSSQLLSKSLHDNLSWVWARLYRRDFLVSNDIKFPNMRFNEDVVFMQKCLDYSDNHAFVKNIVYVWHYNHDSLTRSDESEFMKNAKNVISFIDALSYSHSERRKNNLVANNQSYIQACDGLCMSYWYVVEALAENTNADCENILHSLQNYYNMVTEDYPNIVSSDSLKQSYVNSLGTAIGITQKYIPTITIWQLLDDLEDNKNMVDDVSEYGYEIG